MKKILFALIFLSFYLMTFSQTDVSGEQSGVWTLANSPYNVVDSITVPNGDTLRIEAGVKVYFNGYYKITVNGVLIADGSETDTIVFFPIDTLTGWAGLEFIDASGISHLKYCVLEYGKTIDAAYPRMHGGAVILLNSDAVFEHCVFANNDATGDNNGMGGAVYAMNTGSTDSALTKFTSCKFINNHAYGEGGAIKFSGDINTEIFDCEFVGNNCLYGGGAIQFYNVTNTKVIKTLFAKNYTEYSNGGAANTLGSGNTVYFTNCTFTENEARHGDGGALNIAYGQIYMVNTIIYDNPGTYSDDLNLDFEGYADINFSDLQIPDGATGANNINENPLFDLSDTAKYHLSENSPCIDAGTDVGLPYVGDAPDMGCFEFDTTSAGGGNGGGDDTTTFFASQTRLLIYPNPATDFVVLQSENTSYKEVLFLTAEGRKVKSLVSVGNYKVIDIKNLRPGLYFIIVKSRNDTKSLTFIKTDN